MLPSLSHYLKSELEARKSKNKYYSLRKFAYDLTLSPALLSRIMNGKIQISQRTYNQIEKKINLPAEYKDYTFVKRKNWRDTRIKQLSSNEIALAKKWYFPAVWEIVSLNLPNINSKKIAQLLDIETSAVEETLSLLETHKLIFMDNGKWVTNHAEASTLDLKFTTAELKNIQVEYLHKCIESIQNDELEVRDNAVVVIALNKKLIPFVQDRIKKFRRNLAREVEKKSSDKKDSLYILSTAFNPITK